MLICKVYPFHKTVPQMCQSFEHCCLSPVNHWRLGSDQGITPIVEMAVLILHVCDCPSRHPKGSLKAFWIFIREQGQRINNLSRALDIDRLTAIVVVAWAAVLFDEVVFEICETSRQVFTPALVTRVLDVTLEAIEIVASVKIIDPMVLWIFSVVLSTVGQL